MEGLQYDAKNHKYKLDDKPIPGVSERIKTVGFSSYKDVSEEQMQWYSERGDYVHNATALDDHNNLNMNSLDE